jgi:hypothetical protein
MSRFWFRSTFPLNQLSQYPKWLCLPPLSVAYHAQTVYNDVTCSNEASHKRKYLIFNAISTNNVAEWAALTDRAYGWDAFREYRPDFYRGFTLRNQVAGGHLALY